MDYQSICHSVKIEESATGNAIPPIDFSPLCRWDKTWMLQIVLIYHDMKLMNTLRHSHLFCYQCLAGKASPMRNNFSPKFSLKDDSDSKNCVYFVEYCQYTDYRSWFTTYPHFASIFASPVDFGLNVLFPHIFSVLHRNSIETSWFSLVIHEKPLTEEKSMLSSLDSSILMLPPLVSRRAHLRSLPKKNW